MTAFLFCCQRPDAVDVALWIDHHGDTVVADQIAAVAEGWKFQ